MTEAIDRVAHEMAIVTVAECAKNDAGLPILWELGIDYAQGHAVVSARRLRNSGWLETDRASSS